MTQEDYNDLHSGEKYESYKLTIAMFTANETVAKDALARVARGHSDAFIAAINRENQNFQWKEKHKVAIANLSELNKHTQTLIKECGLEERPQIQGKGGTKRERRPRKRDVQTRDSVLQPQLKCRTRAITLNTLNELQQQSCAA